MSKVGNREALLAGARECLATRGWADTTVRDIAAAAGVSHAAIGYHFGSREVLLTQALVEAVDELADELGRHAGDDQPREVARQIVASFEGSRGLWITQLEAIVQAARSEELRTHLAVGQQQARSRLGGSLPLAAIIGLMVQSVVEPGSSSTDRVVDSLAAMLAATSRSDREE